MITDHIKYALKNLRSRKLRSWLTMMGIFIGIAAVVALIALGNGLKTAIEGQFGLLGSDFLTIQASGTGQGPPGSGVITPLDKNIVDKLRSVPELESVTGRILTYDRLEKDKVAEFHYVGSSPSGIDRKIFIDSSNIEIAKGRFLRDGDKFKIIIGHDVANSPNFPRALNVGDKVKMNGQEFEIVGIMKKRGSFTVDTIVVMNEDVMRELYDIPNRYDIVVAKMKNPEESALITVKIEKIMRKERNVKVGEEDFSVTTPEQNLKTLTSILTGIQIFVVFIAMISLIVGGIGIMNTMYTSVLERRKEIGIMKAIGAKNSTVFQIFLLESGFLGMIGGLIGIIIGASIAKLLAFAGSQALGSDLIQAQISLTLLLGALLFSFLVGSLSGILPAMQAARTTPVNALRS